MASLAFLSRHRRFETLNFHRKRKRETGRPRGLTVTHGGDNDIMSGSDNKEAALAIIRGIVGAATDITKLAREMEQDDSVIVAALTTPLPAPPPVESIKPAAAASAPTPTPALPPPPLAEAPRASSQADVMSQLLKRKPSKT